MKYIYSDIENDKLLHILYRFDDIASERNRITPSSEFLCLSALSYPKGHTFKAHQHIYHESLNETTIAQECWVVISGSVKGFYYDLDGKLLSTDIINERDLSVTLYGGHTFEILEDNTVVYEFKTGPYLGQQKDKVFI